MKRYGVHVCPTCFEQAPPDADGNPEYQCDCDWGKRGLPVYIEVEVPVGGLLREGWRPPPGEDEPSWYELTP